MAVTGGTCAETPSIEKREKEREVRYIMYYEHVCWRFAQSDPLRERGKENPERAEEERLKREFEKTRTKV